MSISFYRSAKLGITVLIMGCTSSVVAYQQTRSALANAEDRVPTEAAVPSDKDGKTPTEKPAKCYLALHLEIVGTPFAARTDTPSGIAHACATSVKTEDDEDKLKS